MSLNIYPTLVQCFGIILVGYLFGKFNLLTTTQSKGIGIFLCQLSLPALIFKAMFEVNFYHINWYFWSGLLITKVLIFVFVAVLTYVFQKSEKFGNAGIYGIFVTVSNDFAFGLPMLQSIFSSPSNKYLVDYLYLVAPINLALINPIGLSMLEYEHCKKQQMENNDDVHCRKSVTKVLLSTLRGIVTNPLIFMMVLGTIGNFIFQNHLPAILTKFFGSLGDIFSATALFFLGLCFALNSSKMTGKALILPTMLAAVKGILMPILMQQIVSALVSSSHHHLPGTISGNATNITTNTTNMLSTEDATKFAFLYGTIPPAPAVAIFAGKYGIGESTVASGLVIGTVLSAPIIIASVRMLQVKKMSDIAAFLKIIGNVCKDISIATILCSAWVILVFFLLCLYKRIPHRFTFMLVLFQFGFGMMGSLFDVYSRHSSLNVIKFCVWLLLVFMYGCYCWTGIIALVVTSMANRMATIQKYWHVLMAVGILLPMLIATIILFTTPSLVEETKHSTYFFQSHCVVGNKVMAVFYFGASVLTLLSIVVMVVKLNTSTDLPKRSSDGERQPLLSTEKSSTFTGISELSTSSTSEFVPSYLKDQMELPCSSCDIEVCKENQKTYGAVDIENISSVMCYIKKTNASLSADNAEKDLSYLHSISDVEKIKMSWLNADDTFHLTYHIVLLIFMGFIILLNFILIIWRLIKSDVYTEGVHLEFEMLSAVLMYGQGFISFVVFGFLKELFNLPILERLSYGCSACIWNKKIVLKNVSLLDPETVLLCDRFKKNHLQWCANDIVTTLRFRFKNYENVFTGTALVDWLVQLGLTSDRVEAVNFGDQLMQGGVIEHCTQQHHFYDLPYLYQFKCELNLDKSRPTLQSLKTE